MRPRTRLPSATPSLKHIIIVLPFTPLDITHPQKHQIMLYMTNYLHLWVRDSFHPAPRSKSPLFFSVQTESNNGRSAHI